MKVAILLNEISTKTTGVDVIGQEHTHEVRDNLSDGRVVGKYRSLKRAHHAADKKDLEYGAVRYSVHRIK